MDLSIGKLQQLVMVARLGGFSRAAAELNISQPALSRSIAAIESRYGFQIFNRQGHGVTLTAAGTQVIAQAEPLLQTMRVFDNNLRLFGSGKAGRLRLGLAPLLASQVLARLASDFFAPDSAAQLQVRIRPGPDLLDELRDDTLELFLYPESHIEPTPDIEVEPFGHIVPVCVVRAGHPLAGRGEVSRAEALSYPWASSLDAPIQAGLPGLPRFICDNYHILRDAVLGSSLVCICSAAFVAAELATGSLRAIHIAGLPLPPTPIHLARLRGRVISPLAEEALDHLRALLAADAAPMAG